MAGTVADRGKASATGWENVDTLPSPIVPFSWTQQLPPSRCGRTGLKQILDSCRSLDSAPPGQVGRFQFLQRGIQILPESPGHCQTFLVTSAVQTTEEGNPVTCQINNNSYYGGKVP